MARQISIMRRRNVVIRERVAHFSVTSGVCQLEIVLIGEKTHKTDIGKHVTRAVERVRLVSFDDKLDFVVFEMLFLLLALQKVAKLLQGDGVKF